MKKDFQYVLQENMYDCGVAALKTIFLQYGKVIKTKDIIKININQGMTALQIVDASKRLGLIAKGVKTNLNSLNSNSFPCIAHVIKEKSYFHYMVIFDKNEIKKELTILDPAIGIIKMSYDKFKEITTNIFIIFEPKQLIKTRDNRFKNFIKDLIVDKKKIILSSLFLSILFIIFSLIFNYYLTILLQYKYQLKIVFFISIVFIIISLFKNFIEYYKNKIVIHFNAKLDKKIYKKITNHIIRLPYNYYLNKSTGELVTLVSDIDNFKSIVSKVYIVLFVDVFMCLSIIIFMGFYNIIYSLIFLVLLIILLFLAKRYQYVFNNYYFKLKNHKISFNSKLVEGLDSFETIKNLNIEEKIITNLNNINKVYLKEEYNYNFSNNKYLLKNNLIIELFYIIIILLSCIVIFNTNNHIYDIVFFSSVFYLFISFSNNICDIIATYKTYQVSVERVLDILDEVKESDSEPKVLIIKEINYNNVSFSYNKKNVLKNINLSIKKNDRIFISGSSGIGKSTLIKLLLKYIELDKGTIAINNQDIKYVDKNTIRNNITYVSQNEKVFTDTIYNNLKIVNSNEQEIEKALNTCLLNKVFIEKNITTSYILEENGSNLSGGERKRILIARSLLKNSNFIIFDESFNELDVNAERRILENIFNNYPELTIILISHRENNKDLFNESYELVKNELIKKEE